MAQIPELTCHICENTNGKFFCYECHIILCEKCKKDHYKYPANKHHTIKETQSKIFSVKYECEQHHKDYLHYCQNCERLICSECITLEHNGHVFKGIKSIADNARKTVAEAISNLKTKQHNYGRAKDEISSSKMVKIQNETEKYFSEVHCLSKSLNEIIETVVKTESTFAGDFLDLEKTKLESFLEILNESVDAHSSIINKLENVLLEAHDVTFYLNQAKILKEFQGSESGDIPTFEEVKDLQKFETADFIEKVVEKIQTKHGIRSLQNKEIQEKQLSERLKQEEISHQQTKEANIAERQTLKETIQSKEMQENQLSERLKQEEIIHKQTKEANITERQKLEATIHSKDHQVEHLLKQMKQDEINHKQTIEAIVAERLKLEVTIQSKENKEKHLFEQLKQEELRHQQTKDANIADRHKLKTALQTKDMQVQIISQQLRQEEISHMQIKGESIAEREQLKAKIQCKEIKEKKLSERLKQEELDNKQTKEAIIAERQNLQAKIQRKEVQEKQLAEQLKQEGLDHKQTKESIIIERQKFQEAIDSKDIKVENICKQLRQEEISHIKMKEAIIAERQKMKTSLTIVLFGISGSGKSATGNTLLGKKNFQSKAGALPVTEFIEKNVVIFAGKKIDIFDTPGSNLQDTHTFKQIYKLIDREESNVFFVYNMSGNRANHEVTDNFKCFLSSCMERNQKFIIVFTRHELILADINDRNSFNGKGYEDYTSVYQWLKHFIPTVSTAVKQNNIRCMFIENNGSWESREKYRQELFSICGINIV